MSTGESNGLPVKRESGEPGHPKDNLEQGELFPSELAKRVLQIEQQRIDRDNQRTSALAKLVEAADAADKRQFEYRLKRLEADDRVAERHHELEGRRFRFARWLIGGGCFVGALLLLAVIGMAFGGDEAQRDTARVLLIYGFTVIGGYGVVSQLVRVFRWLAQTASGRS